MGRKNETLYKQFRPASYVLSIKDGTARLVIKGLKLSPHSKRVALHQRNLRILSARITQTGKKGTRELKVTRINRLPTIEQVRLHTHELIYPGLCEITLEYKLNEQKISELKSLVGKQPNRELLPSIDEPAAWSQSTVKIPE